MSERDELAKLLFTADNSGAKDPEREWEFTKIHPSLAEYAYDQADAILAAGYRRPRTITTVEELDALPNGSVVLDSQCESYQSIGDGLWESGDVLSSKWMALPATVLHEAVTA